MKKIAWVLLLGGVTLTGCSEEAGDKRKQQDETAGLAVSSARARACDVLFEDSAQVEVSEVRFGEGVQGTFVREGRHTAASFFSTADAPIPDGAVQVRARGGEVGALTVGRVSCADRNGRALADVEITVKS